MSTISHFQDAYPESPVVYIDRHEFSFNENWLDEPTMKAICREMELCALADESDYTVHDLVGFGGRRIEFRFWWDWIAIYASVQYHARVRQLLD